MSTTLAVDPQLLKYEFKKCKHHEFGKRYEVSSIIRSVTPEAQQGTLKKY